MGYFACAQYDVLFIPYRRRCRHFPSAGDAPFSSGYACHLRLRGGRAPFVAIATFSPFQRGHLPVSSGKFTPKEEARFVFCLCERSEAISREGEFPQSMYFFTLVVGYFACAQYDVLELVSRGRKATAAMIRKFRLWGYSVRRAITGSFLLARREGISPAMSVSTIEIATSISPPCHGSTATFLISASA